MRIAPVNAQRELNASTNADALAGVTLGKALDTRPPTLSLSALHRTPLKIMQPPTAALIEARALFAKACLAISRVR